MNEGRKGVFEETRSRSMPRSHKMLLANAKNNCEKTELLINTSSVQKYPTHVCLGNYLLCMICSIILAVVLLPQELLLYRLPTG